MIFPVTAARNTAGNLIRYAITSSILGVASSFLGTVISASIVGTIPAGPLIVITGAVFFLGSWILNAKKMQTKIKMKLDTVAKRSSSSKDRNILGRFAATR